MRFAERWALLPTADDWRHAYGCPKPCRAWSCGIFVFVDEAVHRLT